MWRSVTKVAASLSRRETCLLQAENILCEQLRTTFILKRRTTPFLHKQGLPRKKLRTRHYVYEMVKDTSIEQKPNIDVILSCYVDGLGNVGDKVSVKPFYAYHKLLLPGLAVYATPENVEKFKKIDTGHVVHYSSAAAKKIMEILSNISVSIIMNKDAPWTIEPWHIKASFRKMRFEVPEHAIEIPAKPIKGPNMDIEGKEFYVTVTINNTEKAKVKCRIHHWSTDIKDKLPYQAEYWKAPSQMLFPDEESENTSLESKN